MKMIIDVDEKVYNDIKKDGTYENYSKAVDAVINGMPFSGEHGDLIDRNELLSTFKNLIKTYCVDEDNAESIFKDNIKEIPPIIKGNLSEEEKLQEFLQNNNISDDRIKYHFEDGKLTTLRLSCCKIQGTVSFKDFPNLKLLDLAYNDITDVDLTQNFDLKTLYLQNNNLANIDVTKNRNLEYLDLGYNNLTNIDLTKNSKLEDLILPHNRLANIDLTKNSELGRLDLEDNNFTVIDLIHNNGLYDIGIDPDTEVRISGDVIRTIAY